MPFVDALIDAERAVQALKELLDRTEQLKQEAWGIRSETLRLLAECEAQKKVAQSYIIGVCELGGSS